MLLKAKASLEFIQEPVSEKTTLGGSIIDGIINNAQMFPNLPVTTQQLGDDNNALTQAAVAAKTGDHVAIALLTVKEKAWDHDFRDTANYVSVAANGSEVIIRSAGLTPTKTESQPVQPPGQVQNFDVNVIKGSGIFSAECDPMHSADAFIYTAMPDGVTLNYAGDLLTINCNGVEMYIIIDTHRKVNFTSIPGNKTLNVSMYAVNRAGCGPATASQPVTPQK